LESIRNQSYRNIEIIVVDKNSRDKTVEIAKNYNAKVFQLNAERAEAKNFGLGKAIGKYVCFIDSDMELTKNVIKECVNLIENNGKIGGIIIPERSVSNSFWAKVRDFERSFYAGTEIESARFFRKDLAEKVGGFDENIVFFEESTLPQQIEKLGYNVRARINAEILHHEEDFALWRWLKKKYYYGKTASVYRDKYNDLSKKQMSLFYRFGLFFRNKRFYSKPLLALGVIILKFSEYFSAGLGYLVSKVRK
jgi:glycosyltransferase involved in cell wall biosynthesis